MSAPFDDRLTNPQKWQIAARVFVIYWPIRLYLNVEAFSWPFFVRTLPFWVIEITLSLLFFYSWISVTEWLQQRFLARIRERTVGEIRTSTQVIMLLLASLLAIGFNAVFHTIYQGLYQALGRDFALFAALPGLPHALPDLVALRERVNNGITVMAMLSAFYLLTNRRASKRVRALQVQTERLAKETVIAQFAALKNQVNPHFLFNNLSILASLVETNPNLSVLFINRLSKAYRYILEQGQHDQIALKTELDFVLSYIFLLNIRFEGKLQVMINVPPDAADRYAVAPLTLQLLVENAVKHNRMSDEDPLLVSIELKDDYLLVINSLQPRSQPEASTGMGLQNIYNRYGLLSDRPVWVGEEAGSFVVKIPLLA